LLRIAALANGGSPETIATEIGEQGAGKLKQIVTESINEHFKAIRERRTQLENDLDFVKSILREGIAESRSVAQKTLEEVREAMNMGI
jgi:tryptophanyl-tRNA synthetase